MTGLTIDGVSGLAAQRRHRPRQGPTPGMVRIIGTDQQVVAQVRAAFAMPGVSLGAVSGRDSHEAARHGVRTSRGRYRAEGCPVAAAPPTPARRALAIGL
ncbi:MAG: hypothetical protein JWR81_5063 [Pseudonocardia sp.]|nr:hypothetical protein [Pseudonocardia sp.]